MDYRKALLKAASLVALTAASQASANAAIAPNDATGTPKSTMATKVAGSGMAASIAKAAAAAAQEQQLNEGQESFKLAQSGRRRPREPNEVGQVPGGGGAPGGGRGS